MRYCQIQRNFRDSEYLCKLGKEYLNHCYASFTLFSRRNLQTFDISHAFLPLTIAKLSTFKNGPVFWPTLYNTSDVELKLLPATGRNAGELLMNYFTLTIQTNPELMLRTVTCLNRLPSTLSAK